MPQSPSRSRLFPASYSRDRRYGRLSLKAVALYPLLWANADDQGRLSGEPDEIKYTACPNISEINIDDVEAVLHELQDKDLVKIYQTSRTAVVQLLDWWDTNYKLQWAWPSEYPSSNGWVDHLRYKKGSKEVVTQNWPAPQISMSLSNPSPRPLTHQKDKDNDKDKEISEEEYEEIHLSPQVNSQVNSHLSPSPSSGTSPKRRHTAEELKIYETITQNFQWAFGKLPSSKETAQAADFCVDLAAAGCSPELVKDAMKEAGLQNKLHLTYVRKIALDWAGSAHRSER